MTVFILTPIPVEHQAILAHLVSPVEVEVEGNRYVRGAVKDKPDLRVVLQLTGPGNTTVALATDKAIRHFQPMVVILAGIAGGVKDVKIGDIAVGTKFYGYESGKETNEGFMIRPAAGSYSPDLVALAQVVARKGHWKRRVKGDTTRSNVIFGPIASGDKVIAAGDGAIARLLKQSYNDTTALEMESNGFGQAMQHHPGIRFMNIRGVSDLLEGKAQTDQDGSREQAAEHMAGFVFELLNQFDISQFKIMAMELKDLVKQIIDLILPIVKMDAAQEIGKDITDATNGTIRELWQKAKPLFIEEYEELKKEPEDGDAQAAARNKLKRSLEVEKELKEELEKLVEEIKSGIVDTKSIITYKDIGIVVGSGEASVKGKYAAGRDIVIKK